MKCLLCELEGIAYAVRVEELRRIEESAGAGPRFHPWQWALGTRGKRRPKATFAGLLHLRGPAEPVLYVDSYSEILEVPDTALTPFPTTASRLPEALFAGVLIRDDGPSILLDPAGFPAHEEAADLEVAS